MSFLRRAERMLDERRPARLDHELLIAALDAQRMAAAAQAGPAAASQPAPGEDEPLVELLLAGPGWRRAASRQRGCFSRAEAGRRINAP
jgi:hypothetical protein